MLSCRHLVDGVLGAEDAAHQAEADAEDLAAALFPDCKARWAMRGPGVAMRGRMRSRHSRGACARRTLRARRAHRPSVIIVIIYNSNNSSNSNNSKNSNNE